MKETNKCVACGTYITDDEKERVERWLEKNASTYSRAEGINCGTCMYFRAALDYDGAAEVGKAARLDEQREVAALDLAEIEL